MGGHSFVGNTLEKPGSSFLWRIITDGLRSEMCAVVSELLSIAQKPDSMPCYGRGNSRVESIGKGGIRS